MTNFNAIFVVLALCANFLKNSRGFKYPDFHSEVFKSLNPNPIQVTVQKQPNVYRKVIISEEPKSKSYGNSQSSEKESNGVYENIKRSMEETYLGSNEMPRTCRCEDPLKVHRGPKNLKGCFLIDIRNPREPTRNCYDDVRWSPFASRFWSVKAYRYIYDDRGWTAYGKEKTAEEAKDKGIYFYCLRRER